MHIRHPGNISVVIVEMEASEPQVLSQTLRWADRDDHIQPKTDDSNGPKFFMSMRDEETDPNHVDFATLLGRRLELTASKRDDYLRRAESKLREIYPRCSKVVHCHLELPVLGGHRLANTPGKFNAQIRAMTDVQVC
jgi:hypothetical protein